MAKFVCHGLKSSKINNEKHKIKAFKFDGTNPGTEQKKWREKELDFLCNNKNWECDWTRMINRNSLGSENLRRLFVGGVLSLKQTNEMSSSSSSSGMTPSYMATIVSKWKQPIFVFWFVFDLK